MAKKLKQNAKNKISKNVADTVRKEDEQYPLISFRYMTTNKVYNQEHYKKDKSKTKEMLSELADRVIEISKQSYRYWNSLDKKSGSETIDYRRLNFKAPDELGLKEIDKVMVFRFNKQDNRLIGYKKDAILYVIGLDLDFTAYNH